MDRRLAIKGIGAGLMLNFLACNNNTATKKPQEQVPLKPQANLAAVEADPVRDLLIKNFIEPLRKDILEAAGDRTKILAAIALRTNETLNQIVDQFSVRTAAESFKAKQADLQQKSLQALLTEMVTALRQFKFVETENFEALIDQGYLYNQNFVEMLNRGQLALPEDYKLINDENDIELFSKISAKSSFDLAKIPNLKKLFQDLGLNENAKDQRSFFVIDSLGVSFLGINYKGNTFVNRSKIFQQAKKDQIPQANLLKAVLANELAHDLLHEKYGNKLSAELNEFISDLATAVLDSRQIIHDRLEVSARSNYVLSRNEIFTAIMDILEEKSGQKILRQAYAQRGTSFIESEIAKAFPEENYQKEFEPKFIEKLTKRAFVMLAQTAKQSP